MARQARKHQVAQTKRPRDLFDFLAYFFTFATPLFEVPQALEIFINRSAQNVSILTWGFFCLDNFVWIAYAWRRKLWPLLITSALYEAIEVSILVGILVYR